MMNMNGVEAQHDGKALTVLQAGVLFSLVVALFLIIGVRAQRLSIYPGLLVTEVLLVLLPTLIFLFRRRLNLAEALRLKKIPLVNLLLVPLLMLLAIPLVGAINILNLIIVKSWLGRVVVSQPPVGSDFLGVLVSVLVIAGSAAVCEETLFRGGILPALRPVGKWQALLLSSLLFGMMHMDIQKIFATTVLGCLIGWLVYESGSLFTGMLAHFSNNTIAVLTSVFAAKLAGSAGKATEGTDPFAGLTTLSKEQIIAVVVMLAVLLLVDLLLLGGVLIWFRRINKKTEPADQAPSEGLKKKHLMAFIPGVLMILMMYATQSAAFMETGSTFVRFVKVVIGG